MVASIVLTPDQDRHVDRLLEIMSSLDGWAMDLSMLGSGKTYTTTVVAQRLELAETLVVCPKAVVSKWVFMQRTHGLGLMEEPMTWRKMAGNRIGRKPAPAFSHPYLTARLETVVEGEPPVTRTVFEATPAWHDLVERGVLLVMDEFQNIKNSNTDQMLAAKELIRVVVG